MKQVRAGDVVFHRTGGPLAAAIRLATGCHWSHVSLVTAARRLNREFWILDVAWSRAVRSILARAGDRDWVAFRPRYAYAEREPRKCDVNGVPNAWIGEHAASHALQIDRALPRRYPVRELLAYLPLVRGTGLQRRMLADTDRAVCSATVAAAWHAVGLRLRDGMGRELGPDWADPGTLWRQCVRDQWTQVMRKAEFDGLHGRKT